MQRKSVSIFWQCLATLTIPTGLLAFKRVKKFRMGVLLNIIMAGLTLGSFALFNYVIESEVHLFTVTDNIILSTALIGLVSVFIVPIYFMYKWSKEWNKQVTEILR